MITLLIVDGELSTRLALRQALTQDGYAVVTAASGEEALHVAASETPDLILLDVVLPGMNGIDVCRELRTWCSAPILFVSSSANPDDKICALDVGADDYVAKPCDLNELGARVRSHLRRAGDGNKSEPVLETEGLRLDLARRQFFKKDREIRLTRIEFSLLHYMMQNAGRIVTYRVLLSQVWGPRHTDDVQLLRVHVGNLRRKIESDVGHPQYIVTELGVGYRFKATSDLASSIRQVGVI